MRGIRARASRPRHPAGARAAISMSGLVDRPHHTEASGEDRDAQREDAPAPVVVPEGAADQDQGRQEQGVGLDDPLRVDGCGPEANLYLRKRDVGHRAVDKRHRRPDDGRREYPRPRPRCARRVGLPGPDNPYVTGRIAYVRQTAGPLPSLRSRSSPAQKEEPSVFRNSASSGVVFRPRISFLCGNRPNRSTISLCPAA